MFCFIDANLQKKCYKRSKKFCMVSCLYATPVHISRGEDNGLNMVRLAFKREITPVAGTLGHVQLDVAVIGISIDIVPAAFAGIEIVVTVGTTDAPGFSNIKTGGDVIVQVAIGERTIAVGLAVDGVGDTGFQELPGTGRADFGEIGIIET